MMMLHKRNTTRPYINNLTSVSPSKPIPQPVSQTANEIAEIMPTVEQSPDVLLNSHWISVYIQVDKQPF